MRTSDTQSIGIVAPRDDVLDFVADPRNLPRWSPDFAQAVRPDGEAWLINSGDDEMRIDVRVSRELGTVDFLAAGLPTGIERGAFTRVVSNGRSSEYLFTQFFGPDMTVAETERRRAVIRDELERVRAACERPPSTERV